MKRIAIYGAGGLGREIAVMVDQINASTSASWELIGFFDDGKQKGTVVDGLPVLGGLDDLNAFTDPIAVALAIADPAARRRIQNSIRAGAVSFPTLIHPSVNTGDIKRNHFAEGALIAAGCIFTTSIDVHPFAIVNLSCTIGHDVTIGSFSIIMPGSSISGCVAIGAGVLVGSGARLLPGVAVGDNARVGAGAVVVKDVSPNVTVVGVPAKIVRAGLGAADS